ncbi:adenylate/guanylate cyclase domain-containing protein [bacterium]|nr:adenylate/guanylate cyclase domain-containing protein [bacterium]
MKWVYSGYAVIVSILLLTALKIADPTPLQNIRNQTFDAYQQLDEIKQSNEVVIINIGEKSLQALGQYPFPRTTYAQLIYDIRQKNQGIVGFTIMFPEADRFAGDEVFASWIKGNGIVLSQTPSTKGIKSTGPHIGTGVIGPTKAQDYLLTWPNLVTNIPELEAEALGIGVNASAPQPDFVTRTYPLAIGVEGKIYPSFAIEMLRVQTGKPSYIIKTTEIGVSEFAVPPFEPIVTLPKGDAYIRYNNTFEEVEYTDINSLPNMGGKFVIVGVTAEGISNPVPTPRGNLYPQHIQAHMLQNFIDGSNITRNQLSPLIELLCALCGMILIALAVYKLPLLWTAPISLLILGGEAYGSVWLYQNQLVLLDATYPVLSGFLVFTQSAFNNFYKQYKLRQQIKGQFGTYISPDYVDMLVKDPSLMKLGGERKVMSFMFADIVGFTPISEKYMKDDDPEGLVELINGFLDKMTKIVLKNGGTIDKFMGDCIMAFWNAPLPCDNHAEMAVKTAIEIELLGDELEKEMEERGLPRVKFGTGVNTGTCIVGNMGAETRLDYSVVGDAVNLGARLEAQTRAEDTPILVSEFTYMECPDIAFAKMGEVTVKGKEDPVKIYAPLFDGETRKLYK